MRTIRTGDEVEVAYRAAAAAGRKSGGSSRSAWRRLWCEVRSLMRSVLERPRTLTPSERHENGVWDDALAEVASAERAVLALSAERGKEAELRDADVLALVDDDEVVGAFAARRCALRGPSSIHTVGCCRAAPATALVAEPTFSSGDWTDRL